MTPQLQSELVQEELELLQDEALSTSAEPWVNDEWSSFWALSEEEQKWALIQLQLDREAKMIDRFSRGR